MDLLRTPDERFADLEDWPYAAAYVEVDGVRVHHVDEGPPDADPVLCLHGEPTWAYLYRKVVPPLLDAGLRVVVPDLVGFGRSDKPARVEHHTYAQHVRWMRGFVTALDLRRTTLVCQDWGGFIGLRVAVADDERFDRIVAANTGLVTGDTPMPDVWHRFKQAVQSAPVLDVGRLVAAGCTRPLADAARRAYDAPFPDEALKAGPRAMPGLVPTAPDDPETAANREALAELLRWQKPFLTAFSDGDPITRGADRLLQRAVAGAAGQPHTTIEGAGHFLQEDAGERLGQVVADFVRATR